MKRLTVLYDPIFADLLIEKLLDANINASLSDEKSPVELYLGGQPGIQVWIAEKTDVDRATEILSSLDSEKQSSQSKCHACGYDLRGHVGDTACPECGAAVSTGDRPCPHCQESVPVHFEVCWSCGKTVE